jgi:hypothetical protein
LLFYFFVSKANNNSAKIISKLQIMYRRRRRNYKLCYRRRKTKAIQRFYTLEEEKEHELGCHRFQTQPQEQKHASKLTFGIAKRAEMQDTV